MDALTVRMRTPSRGYFLGLFAAPPETDARSYWIGSRGERATCVGMVGEFPIMQFDAHVASMEYGDDGSRVARFKRSGGPAPAFSLSPFVRNLSERGIAPRIDEVLDDVVIGSRLDEIAAERTFAATGLRCVQSTRFADLRTSVLVWMSIRSGSAVIDFEWLRIEHSREETELDRAALVFVAREAIVGRDRHEDPDRDLVVESICPTAGLLRGRFRVLCGWAIRDGMEDDRTASELVAATESVRPVIGLCDELGESGRWFGVDRLGAGESLLTSMEVFGTNSTGGRPWAPQAQPNDGGTDPCFSACPAYAQLSLGDPEAISAIAANADSWLRHPVYYLDPGKPLLVGEIPRVLPLPWKRLDGAIHGLSTHKLQPWGSQILGVPVPTPDSKPDPRPFDGQHRAFALAFADSVLSESFAMHFALDLVLRSETYDRRCVLRSIGSGREEGRIAQTVVFGVRSGHAREPLRRYLAERLERVERLRPTADSLGTPEPTFLIDRGVPWLAWTPWEEAQLAWGAFLVWREFGDEVALEHARRCARNVSIVLRRFPDGFAIPWRVRWITDDMPDLSLESTDVDGWNFGPRGTFAWASIGLRVLVALAEEFSEPIHDGHRLAALALREIDQREGLTTVDANMTLRGSFDSAIERILSGAIGDA